MFELVGCVIRLCSVGVCRAFRLVATATGEHAVIVNAADSDIIIGPIGIVFANALLGEITPAIATAIGASKAYKILIPVNRCNHYVAGCTEASMSEYIKLAINKIESML